MARFLFRRRSGRRRSAASMLERKTAIEQRYGPWTAHNAQLSEDVWTVKDGAVNFDEKMRRAVQVAHDFFGPRLRGLRVLDLGAGEGGLSLEFARQGAQVVCVEGREANLEKARFVAEALGIENISFLQDDVRNLRTLQREFDLALCYGLLYHLEAAAVFELIENIHRLTARLAVIDTHYSLVAAHTEEFRGEAYAGSRFREHAENATTEEKLGRPWSSLHNTSSFWLTRPALFNLLHRVGFSTVYEAQAPLVYDYYDRATDERFKYDDRSTFVAVKSVPARILTSPAVNRMPHRRWPESLGDRLVPSPREL